MSYFHIPPLKFHAQVIPSEIDIYELFLRAYAQFEHVIFLESLGEYSDFSRYSVLMFEPEQMVSARGRQLIVDGKSMECANPYDALREIQTHLLPRSGYAGGLYGYLGYEATEYFEPAVEFGEHPDFPAFELGLFLDGIVYDKQLHELSYFTVGADRRKRVDALIAGPPATFGTFGFTALGSNTTQDEYLQMIHTAKEHIAAGDIFQVVLAVQYGYELQGDKRRIYDALRQVNPSPYLSYIKFGQREIITSSVDLVSRVRRNAQKQFVVENFPLAGTTLRGQIPSEDEVLFDAMRANAKERAEHMMLVDLGRNDLGRVCEFGSVKVDELMVPKRFSHVQHMESKLKGTLRSELNQFDCVSAASPMGTVSGAPKIEAMKIIHALEKAPRGPYAGEIGGFGLNGECIFSVGLRSLFIVGDKAYSQVGSGVVQDSTPEQEAEEIERKARGMEAALKLAKMNSSPALPPYGTKAYSKGKGVMHLPSLYQREGRVSSLSRDDRKDKP